VVGICEEAEGDGFLESPSIELAAVRLNDGAAVGSELNMVGVKVGGLGV